MYWMQTIELGTALFSVLVVSSIFGFLSYVAAYLLVARTLIGRTDADGVHIVSSLWAILPAMAIFGAIAFSAKLWISFYFYVLIASFIVFGVVATYTILHAAELAPYFRRLKGKRGETEVRKILDSTGYESLHDVYVRDGDHVYQIDHIVRTAGTILVVETKNWHGTLLSGKDDRNWSYVHGGMEKTLVGNPIRQVQGHAIALSRFLGSRVEVDYIVAFTSHSEFVRGMPEGTLKISGLPSYIRHLDEGLPSTLDVEEAWEKLKLLSSSGEQVELRKIHAEQRADREMILPMPAAKTVEGTCRGCGKTNTVLKSRVPGSGFDTDYWKCLDCGVNTSIVAKVEVEAATGEKPDPATGTTIKHPPKAPWITRPGTNG